MPVTRILSYQWYDTPNIHLCTIRDFTDLCTELDIKVERALSLALDGAIRFDGAGGLANLLAEHFSAGFQLVEAELEAVS